MTNFIFRSFVQCLLPRAGRSRPPVLDVRRGKLSHGSVSRHPRSRTIFVRLTTNSSTIDTVAAGERRRAPVTGVRSQILDSGTRSTFAMWAGGHEIACGLCLRVTSRGRVDPVGSVPALKIAVSGTDVESDCTSVPETVIFDRMRRPGVDVMVERTVTGPRGSTPERSRMNR
jgi:hypothetical protein